MTTPLNANPWADGTASLGSPGTRWQDFYIAGTFTDGTQNVAMWDLARRSDIGQAVGAGANSFFLIDVESGVGTYHNLTSYPYGTSAPDTARAAAASGTIRIDSYISGTLAATQIAGGLWEFKDYASVSTSVGVTQFVHVVSKYTSAGTTVLLFSVDSPEINNTATTPIEYVATSAQGTFAVAEADRLVVDYYLKTTSTGTVGGTLYYGGTSNFSHVVTPIAFSHNQLAGLNLGDYQHLTYAQGTGLTNGGTTYLHTHAGVGTTGFAGGTFTLSTVVVDTHGRVTYSASGTAASGGAGYPTFTFDAPHFDSVGASDAVTTPATIEVSPSTAQMTVVCFDAATAEAVRFGPLKIPTGAGTVTFSALWAAGTAPGTLYGWVPKVSHAVFAGSAVIGTWGGTTLTPYESAGTLWMKEAESFWLAAMDLVAGDVRLFNLSRTVSDGSDVLGGDACLGWFQVSFS